MSILRLFTIHIDLSLLANIDYNTVAVICVFQGAATEHEVFNIARSRLFQKACVATSGIEVTLPTVY